MEKSHRLRQVYRGGTGDVETIFIVVPGIGTLTPQQWVDENGNSWLRTAGQPTSEGLIVFSFDHDLLVDGALSWTRVEEEGTQLLNEIKSLIEAAQFATCPLVLVAHSLGGVVLKRAICFAHRQQRWQDLLQQIAGVILFSCPHSLSKDSSNWQQVTLILKAFARSRRKHIVSAELAENLAADCQCFEREFGQKAVVSVHEEEETSTGKMPWHKSILVDEAAAHPRVNGLISQGLKCDHNHTCCLKSDKNVANTITDFINRVVGKTRKDIGFRDLLDYDRPPALDQSTVASQSDLASTSGVLSKRKAYRPSVASASTHLSPAGTSSRFRETNPSTVPSQGPRASLTGISSAKNDPQLPCFYMPYHQNPRFHGRKQTLAKIRSALAPRAAGPNAPDVTGLHCFAISGPGGIGKTQVAAQFIYEQKDSFDAVLWVQADDIGKLNRSFGRIAVTLGLVEEDSADAQDEVLTRDLVLGWLAQPLFSYKQRENEQAEEASWVVVFDNVDIPALLDDFWPKSSSGSILLTSRAQLGELQYYSTMPGIVLPPFDLEETAGFLLKVTNREDDEEDRSAVSGVAEILGGIPLAVAQMAGSIVRRDITFAEFVQEYKDPRTHASLFRQPVGNKGSQGYQHTILSVWGLENLKHSAFLLDVLAFLDPDGIPEYILQNTEAITDMDGLPRSRSEFDEARAELLQSSLVSRDRTTKKLVIHRLIQDIVRARMSDERYSVVFVSALQLLSGAWPYEDEFGFIKNETYRWRQCNELYKHVLHLRKLSARLTPPNQISRAHIQPATLVLEAAWLSILRADYTDTMPLIEMAEELCESLKQDKAGLTAQSDTVREEFEEQLRMPYFHRGALAHHTNDGKAALLNCKTFYTILREKLGESNDQRLGIALNELGVAYLQNNDAEESERCLRRSIAIFEDLSDINPNTMSMPIINLGFALWVQGRQDEAAVEFQRTLTARAEAYGPDDTKSFALGKLLLGYGNVRTAQGKLDESQALHERCLAQYKVTVGPYHHRTGDGYVHVAEHFIIRKRFREALELLDQASRIFGSRDYFKPEDARVCYKRWRVLRALGRAEEAKQAASDALKSHQSLHPEDIRQLEDLSDHDFDNDVMFWSR